MAKSAQYEAFRRNEECSYTSIQTSEFPSTPVTDKTPHTMASNELADAIKYMEGTAAAFAESFIKDPKARVEYNQRTKAASDEIVKLVKERKITPFEGALSAHRIRKDLKNIIRKKSTYLGEHVAINIKKDGPSFYELESKYAEKLFHKSFDQLSQSEREAVWVRIVEGSGTPQAKANLEAKIWGIAGRTLMVMAVFSAAYNIYEAKDKTRQASKEAVTFGSGIVGGAAGGALSAFLLTSNPIGWVTGLAMLLAGAVSVAASSEAFDMYWIEKR
ncbi:hypothetical protein RGU70_14575 [Herbaspirillum sp. RTI4]|uniref:hypothetical protein n=1 Tax=Herbaspirillum sp. RTI4 TaxID=3048640 RepID=UPI002AB338B2|nr:hypothetical protein [Herbaspirillum sp. RTI4]MDY7579538.1 hypothetical protein [Herbaspirillum sp. RTI4]MEA9981830.1 hypothetical protein [Herbaspirillum sp. RTI4]